MDGRYQIGKDRYIRFPSCRKFDRFAEPETENAAEVGNDHRGGTSHPSVTEYHHPVSLQLLPEPPDGLTQLLCGNRPHIGDRHLVVDAPFCREIQLLSDAEERRDAGGRVPGIISAPDSEIIEYEFHRCLQWDLACATHRAPELDNNCRSSPARFKR